MNSGCSCCSVTKLCLTLCNPIDCNTQAPLSFTISQSLFKFISIESVMQSLHLILCHPLLLWRSFFAQDQGLFHPKVWSFSFSISPSNVYSGLISFGIDLFDLLAVQAILKSLHQHRNSKTLHLRGVNTFDNLSLK